MKKFCILQDKGGCGKSSLAINLSYGLAKKGYKVLLVDNDPQANTTSNTTKASKPLNEKAMEEIVNEFKKECLINSNVLLNAHQSIHKYVEKKLFDVEISDVYMKPERIREAIIETEYENLSILPSSHKLSELDFQLKAAPFNRETRLRDAFDIVKDDYDIVIIDNSPFTNALTYNAMSACYEEGDQILIPITIDQFGLEGLDYTMKTLFDWLQYAPYPMNYDLKIVVGMTKRTRNCKKGIETIKEIFGERVLDSTIRFQDKPIGSSFLNKQILLNVYSNTPIAQDYQNVIDEIEQKIIKESEA